MGGLFPEYSIFSTRVLPADDSKHREPISQGLQGGERQTCSRPNPRFDGNDDGNVEEKKEVCIRKSLVSDVDTEQGNALSFCGSGDIVSH